MEALQNIQMVVKCFPGATTIDMEDYMKRAMKKNPIIIILHHGTNDVSKTCEPKTSASGIMDLAENLKTIIVSGIIKRNYNIDFQRENKIN